MDEFEQTRIPFISYDANNIDADSIINSGMYAVGSAGNNFPENFSAGILIVLMGIYSIQIVFKNITSDSNLFFRWKYGSANWQSNWHPVK